MCCGSIDRQIYIERVILSAAFRYHCLSSLEDLAYKGCHIGVYLMSWTDVKWSFATATTARTSLCTTVNTYTSTTCWRMDLVQAPMTWGCHCEGWDTAPTVFLDGPQDYVARRHCSFLIATAFATGGSATIRPMNSEQLVPTTKLANRYDL